MTAEDERVTVDGHGQLDERQGRVPNGGRMSCRVTGLPQRAGFSTGGRPRNQHGYRPPKGTPPVCRRSPVAQALERFLNGPRRQFFLLFIT